MSYAVSKVAKSSTVVNFLFASVLLSACQKSPRLEMVEPVVVEPVESVEESVNVDDEDVEVDSVDGGEQSSEAVEDTSVQDEDSKTEEQDALFADQVNNAVALLTVDEASAQKGLDALQELDQSNESSPEVPYNIGVAQLKLGNDRAAEKAFERAIELDPTFGKSWFNLGVILERQGKYTDAIGVYEEGLTHSEMDPDLSAGKIACLRKSGQLDEAIAYAQQVLGKNANNVSAYSEVGAVYLEQGNLDKALFVLQQAAARNGSENAKLQSIMGQVYYAQEKLPLAEIAFRKSLELDASLVETAMYLSFLQLQNRAWASASETLDAAIKLDPTNGALLNAMGISQRGQGNIEEAERYYKEAYQVNPSNPEPLLNMAVLEADYRQEYTKALELLDRYLADGGTDVDLADQWRNEFKESEAAYLKEKKQQELRAIFRRRREEAAKKRAEEEAAQQAAQEQESEAVENEESSEDTDEGTEEVTSDETQEEQGDGSDTDTDGATGETQNPESVGVDSASDDGADSEVQSEDANGSTDEDSGAAEGSDDQDGSNGWGAPVENADVEQVDEQVDEQGDDADTDQSSIVNESPAPGDVSQEDTSAEGQSNDEADDNNAADGLPDEDDSGQDASDADESTDSSGDSGSVDGLSGSVDDSSNGTTGPNDATEQPSEENGDTWGSGSDGNSMPEEVDTVVEENGWGSTSTVEAQTCTAQSECTDDLICASTKECLTPGATGTSQINEECETSEDCALSLGCVEQICVQEEQSDVEE